MLALPRVYSIDHASRESTTASPQGLHTSGAPSPLPPSPILCRNSHSSTAAAVAWLASGLVASEASPATSRPGIPQGARTTESGTAPRRLVRACSFERKVGQQRRGSNPNNSTCSKLQRSVSFGRKTREVDYTLQLPLEDPLQPDQLPSVRAARPLRHTLIVLHLCNIPLAAALVDSRATTALPHNPATAASVASLLEPGLP